MKKTLAILVAVAVAGVATADIAVNLENLGSTVTAEGGGFVNQAFVQLVWNVGAPAVAPGTVDLSLAAAGDVILNSLTTTAGFAGTFSDQPQGIQIYTDSTAGYLTARIFDADNLVAGAKYLQVDIDVDGALTAYNSFDTGTIYQTLGTLGGDLGASAYQIVPEPATIGLMGVAGLGMFIARRKSRS